MNSLRKFSACLVCVTVSCRLVSLVTPSTSSAISRQTALRPRIRRFGVFDRVMQQGGDDRGIIHLLLSQDRGDGNGMREIRLARMTKLPLVHLRTKGKGIAQQRFVRAGVIGADQCDQIICSRHSGPAPMNCVALSAALAHPSRRAAISLRTYRLRRLVSSAPINKRHAVFFRLVNFDLCLVRFDHALAQIVSALCFVCDFAQGNDRVLVVVAVHGNAEPAEISRARCAASITSSNRFGTLSTQSSTVTRAMGVLQSIGQYFRKRSSRRFCPNDKQVSSAADAPTRLTSSSSQGAHRASADARSQDRMHPIGRDIRQRHQHKRTVLQTRMRQDQSARVLFLAAPAARSRQCVPLWIGQNSIAQCDQIKIKRALPPATAPVRDRRLPRLVQMPRISGAAFVVPESLRIDKIRPSPCRKGWCR